MERRFDALLDKLLANALDRRSTAPQRIGNLGILLGRTSLRLVRQQQNPRTRQLPRRAPSLRHQRLQFLALLGCQRHSDKNFRMTPSLAKSIFLERPPGGIPSIKERMTEH